MYLDRQSIFCITMFVLVALCSILVPVLLYLSPGESSNDYSLDDFLQGVDVQRSLAEHGKEFESPKIVKVRDFISGCRLVKRLETVLIEFRGHLIRPISTAVLAQANTS